MNLASSRTSAAYLLGAYLSDGTLSYEGRYPHPKWQIVDEPFADQIVAALEGVGSSCSKRWRAPRQLGWQAVWVVGEKAAGQMGCWMRRVVPEKRTLPVIPKDLVPPLIAGLMDGDGCISVQLSERGTKEYTLYFVGNDGFLPKVRELLAALRVKQGKVRSNGDNCLRWTINIEGFLAAGLYFTIPRKQERLAQWCHKVIDSGYGQKALVASWWLQNVY